MLSKSPDSCFLRRALPGSIRALGGRTSVLQFGGRMRVHVLGFGSRQQLIKDRPERVNIRGCADQFTAHLLWTRVLGRYQSPRSHGVGKPGIDFRVEQLRHTEIE